MQTKKRAKPVKFGTSTVKKETVKQEEFEEKIPHKVTKPDVEEDNEKELEVVKDLEIVDEDTQTAQEIKQQIEEKIHPKEADDEPEEVHLTAEEVSDSDEIEKQEENAEVALPKKSPFGSFTNDFSEKPQKSGSNVRFFLLVLVITFVVGLLLIEGIYFFTTNKALYPPDLPLVAKMKPTETPTVTPVPTEKPLDLSAYDITVLNGSGISGEAAKVKTQLTEAKFTVETVGNADADDYTKTVVSAKKSVDAAYLKALKDVLSKNYVIDNEIATLTESNEADVIVTIGSTSAEE